MTELVLTRVVLYKIGVGFFEKRGKIDLSKDKHIELTLKQTTMNDLLKTFSIMRSKGDLIVTGVSYTGQDTNQAKMLQDSLINLPDEDTIKALFSQLRGVEVILTHASEEEKGIVIGIQTRLEAVSDKSTGVIDEPYITLKKLDGSIRNLRLKEIQSLKISDRIVNNDLKFFLDVIRSGKNDKTRNISIYFDGKEQSEFYLNFIQDTPAWKCSYRLFLLDKVDAKDGKEDTLESEILLQGWAIIDNVLNENLENVKLVLVSGLPISFKYDSYSPLWITRPTVERTERLDVKAPQGRVTTRAETGKLGWAGDEQTKSEIPKQDIIKTVVEGANTKGSGFEYRIATPVTVKRNQSSLIPLIQTKGKARLVSVFNESVDDTRPMLTLEMINNTGLVLESGPISIYNDNVFEGEAVLPFMEKDEQQRIPYSVDQAIIVHKKAEEKYQKFHEIEVNTTIYQKRYLDIHTLYKIQNISEMKKILILEHPKQNDNKLYEPEKADEETRNYYRFRITLKPTESIEFQIKERRLTTEYNYFDYLNKDTIQFWLDEKLITEKVFNFLLKLVELEQEKRELQTQINEISNHKQGIAEEQARIRQTMEILGTSTSEDKLKHRYLKKFETAEAEIDEMDKKVTELQNRIAIIEEKLNKMKAQGPK